MPHCVAHGCRMDDSVPARSDSAERGAGPCGVSGQDVVRGNAGPDLLCSRHHERDSTAEGSDNERRGLPQGAEPNLFPMNPTESQDKRPERSTQAPGPQKSPGPRMCPAQHATPETTVLRPQHGAGQIVLNFQGQNPGVTVGDVSSESVCPCHQGSSGQQRVVRQIVLLLLDHPCDSAPQPSQDPPLLVNSRTQTEGPGSHDPSRQRAETPQSCSGRVETPGEGTRGEDPAMPMDDGHRESPRPSPADLLPRPPAETVSSSTQTETPPTGGKPTEPALTVDAWSQTPPDAESASTQLRKCQMSPCHTPLCLNQSLCVGDLLRQHQVTPRAPLRHPQAPPCSGCPVAQSGVRQVVLNFLEEEESKALTQDTPPPGPANHPPPPGSPALRHQGTQTAEDVLQQPLRRPQENADRPGRLQRPSKSQSCPPVMNVSSAPPVYQDEDRGLLAPHGLKPQPGQSAQDKVLFDDVVVYFSKEEWDLLGSDSRGLYKEVMSENYRSLLSLGFLVEKPDLVSRIEREEEELWEEGAGDGGGARRAEENLRFLDLGTGGVRYLKNAETASKSGQGSAGSCSHLGALMRLVNEIPGFLFGGSGTDGSASPIGSSEDPETDRARSQVKMEEGSPHRALDPAPAPPLIHAPDMAAFTLDARNAGTCPAKVTVKVEEEVAVSHSSRHSAPSCHPSISPLSIKSDPGSRSDCVQIKQEASASSSPARAPTMKTRPPFPHPLDPSRRPCSGGGTSPWAAVPVNRSTGTSPRHPSVSPAVSDGTSITELADLKIKVKQEDSGSERDSMESPICDRKVYNSPTMSPASVRHLERDHWRVAAYSRRSPAESVLPGSSPLHKLVNCLKEITSGRARGHSNVFSPAHWVPDGNRGVSDLRAPVKPNPFTAAVVNGTTRLKHRETRTPESRGTIPGRPETLPPPGRMPTRPSSGQNLRGSDLQMSEDPRRTEMGVKRTHSADLPHMPGANTRAKKPALEASGHSTPRRHDLWRPPEDPQMPPGDGQPIGKSHLMSVMECVRKIPSSRPSPPVRGADPDLSRTWKQSPASEEKPIVVKVEESPSPPLPPSSQWLQPDGTEIPGSLATNVHLNGLMRLMEEIPCAESSNSSRAMFSIAVGHSGTRRLDGTNYLSYGNDESGFQAELNDCTVDSVFSDDTSWSSENVDPSYSALGGLQKVLSDFAELGSVSPLVAVTAAPVPVPEGNTLKRPRCVPASPSHDGVRRTPGEASSSACSTENGAAAAAALSALQKVVRGFAEQECVSPMSAVRSDLPVTGLRDPPGKRPPPPEEEGRSPRHQRFSPAPSSRFLCDSSNWASEPDSSYSALIGLQKVVSGFSEMSCVSPFSAVSTPASDPPLQESFPTPSGMKWAANGVCDPGCDSPLTVTSYLSSEGEPDPGVRRKCDPAREDLEHANDSYRNIRNTPSTSNHCIDLTQEEEPTSGQPRTSTQETQKKQKFREGSESSGSRPVTSQGVRATRPISRGHLIDLTKEEEPQNKPKEFNLGTKPKVPHPGSAHLCPPPDETRRACKEPSGTQRVPRDKPLAPGPCGPSRGGVPVVNEHLSGLEKLLKGVPSLTPTSDPRTPTWSGSWWFKSTSPHET